MRILFLASDHLDYVSDPLYVGLSRILGDGAVVDYPYKGSLHDPARVPWCLVPTPGRAWTREEIVDRLRDKYFDLVCLASFRQECFDECAELYRKVPFPPMVFIDGSDDEHIRHDLLARYPLRIYFKRDYIWKIRSPWKDQMALLWTFRGDRGLFARTVPLPLSLVMETLPAVDSVRKDIDVSYRGRASHPRRTKAVSILSRLEGVRFSGAVYASPGDRKYKLKAGRSRRAWTKVFDDGPAPRADQQQKEEPTAYYRELAASKIALHVRGGGHTASLRYFEIVGMGAMLLSDAPETLIPHDFVDRQHAVFCRPDLRDLETLVRYYLKENEERELITNEGRAHLLKYHTCERRAEYFLNVCARMI
ncbi:MAG TPA: glycosyltransferase [Nitrospirales bacterium]|jgi:hypothetical protein